MSDLYEERLKSKDKRRKKRTRNPVAKSLRSKTQGAGPHKKSRLDDILMEEINNEPVFRCKVCDNWTWNDDCICDTCFDESVQS